MLCYLPDLPLLLPKTHASVMTRPRRRPSPIAVRKLLCDAAAKNGLSLSELTKRIGFSRESPGKTVSRILGKEECDPRLSIWIAMMEAVNMPTRNLLDYGSSGVAARGRFRAC
jgi:hypothetical protein